MRYSLVQVSAFFLIVTFLVALNNYVLCFKRDITKFKPLSSKISVSMLTGDSFDEEIPERLNQVSVYFILQQKVQHST